MKFRAALRKEALATLLISLPLLRWVVFHSFFGGAKCLRYCPETGIGGVCSLPLTNTDMRIMEWMHEHSEEERPKDTWVDVAPFGEPMFCVGYEFITIGQATDAIRFCVYTFGR